MYLSHTIAWRLQWSIDWRVFYVVPALYSQDNVIVNVCVGLVQQHQYDLLIFQNIQNGRVDSFVTKSEIIIPVEYLKL